MQIFWSALKVAFLQSCGFSEYLDLKSWTAVSSAGKNTRLDECSGFIHMPLFVLNIAFGAQCSITVDCCNILRCHFCSVYNRRL